MTTEPTKSAPQEEPKASDTAELKGDKIEVQDDFSEFANLSQSKLRLVNSNNVDVEESIPNWHFAWFTEEDADEYESMGWMKVHEQFGDNVRAPAQTKQKRDDQGHIAYRDLIAYCWPMKKYRRWIAYLHEENVMSKERALAESAAASIEGAMGGGRSYGDHHERGTGIVVER